MHALLQSPNDKGRALKEVETAGNFQEAGIFKIQLCYS